MACFATSYSLPIRYTNNVYHQAELVYAMLAGALPTPPDDIIWGAPPISAWARSMLQLMLPGARVHESINASEAVGCRVFNEAPSAGIYFRSAKTAKEIRAHALKQCGLADRQADIVTPLVVFMPRAAASSVQSAGRRNFVRRREIVEQLRMLNGSRVKVVPSPSASMPICEQISVWAMADAIATPNGAHFVNAPFLPRGAVLVEGVPWSMRHYVGQLRITQHFSTRHLRAHSSRPPPSPLLGRFSAVGSEQECEVNQACQHAYRDRANLHVEPQAIIAALSPLLNCRDDDDWQNPHGKTCADYGRAIEPTANLLKADPSGLPSGGWCQSGRFKPGAEWASGADEYWPERHCCACGKKQQAPPEARMLRRLA